MDNFESYKNNLKLYLETLKQDLNIILTSTIPTQKNLIKTILWLNITFFATSLTLFQFVKNNIIILFLSMPIIFSTCAIGIALIALLKGRNKTFAHPKLEVFTSLINTEHEELQGLLDLINSYKIAFNKNSDIVKFRAEKIHSSTMFTILSGSSLIIVIILIANLQLGGVMGSDKKTNTPPPTQPREISKPEVSLSTNHRIREGYEGHKHKVESSKKVEKKEGK